MIDVDIQAEPGGERFVCIYNDGVLACRLSDANGHALARHLAAKYGYRTVPNAILRQVADLLVTIEEATGAIRRGGEIGHGKASAIAGVDYGLDRILRPAGSEVRG